MLALLKSALTRRIPIGPRAQVNLVNVFNSPIRTDGVVEAIHGELAYIEWPNGGKSFENVRRLVRIDV
jgi:hypothetical protein